MIFILLWTLNKIKTYFNLKNKNDYEPAEYDSESKDQWLQTQF